MRAILAIVILGLSATFSATPADQATLEKFKALAKQLAVAGDLQSKKDLPAALNAYREAIRIEPAYAANRWLGVVLDIGLDQVGNFDLFEHVVGVLNDDLYEKGHRAQADSIAAQLLLAPDTQDWSRHPRAKELLAVRLRYYADLGLSPETFEWCNPHTLERDEVCGHADFFSRLRNRGGPQLTVAAEDVSRAFLWRLFEEGQIPTTITSVGRASSLFPSTRQDSIRQNPEYRDAFSMMLKRIGDSYQMEENYEDALPLYSSAWLLDNNNTAAAAQTAAIISLAPNRYDPDRAIVEAITQTYAPYRRGILKQPKNLFFSPLKGSYDDQNPDNQRNLARMHRYLSTLPPPETQNTSGMKSSKTTYQLKRAEENLTTLAQQGEPGVAAKNFVSLARTFEENGLLDKAYENYVTAAEYFVSDGELEQARQQLRQAARFERKARDSDRDRYRELLARIEQAGA